MAYRCLGTAALADAFKRDIIRRLRTGAGMATLARACFRSVSFPGLERTFAADDFCCCRHVSAGPPAHYGHRHSINDPPGADDAGTIRGRLADQALWLA